MATTKEQLFQAALRLSPNQRAELVSELLATLEPDTPSERRTEAEWVAEIERRARAAGAGSPGVPWAEARRIQSRFAAPVRAARLSPEAGGELAEAADWYAARRLGLDVEFLTEDERILLLIETSPASFPRPVDLPEDPLIRRALLPRFPYAVVFTDLATEVRVLAVAHAKQWPAYWLNRVEA